MSQNAAERKSRVVVGQLQDDFLRLPDVDNSSNVASVGAINVTVPEGVQLVCAAPFFNPFLPPRTRGRLNVTMAQANLTKNYGFVRMDPYCRLRVGAVLFETPTDPSGGKTPHWNRTIHSYLPEGIDSVYLEIFDERAFTFDERIAWAHIPLPQAIFNGETIDEWYSLSGNQGEGKEGMVNLIFSLDPIAIPQIGHLTSSLQQQTFAPSTGNNVNQAATGQLPFTQADVNELHEMFPTIDEDVIASVLEEKRGNREATVNALLSLNAE
ncbi:toll interacting protein [Trichuris trichiura]|uniref:Toll interacting protein n=1 Tax=Trichuris trichiura TaxID=36087 RepID=A0A077Z8G6_TRITR|nr:toll interacting protein [Trichuris trichiura]